MTTDPTPELRGGAFSSPASLFVLSTAMASTAATAVAFMLFGSAAATERDACTCVCDAPEPAAPAVAKPSAPVEPAAAEIIATPSAEPARHASPADRQTPPRVRQAKAEVKGALDKDIVRRIVRAHINEVRHCYEQGLAADPQLEGRVVVQFTVGPSGKVPVAVVASSDLDDDETAACITKAARRWKFPMPKTGGNAVITYPFVLSPG